jgi:hypothetical protein
MGVRTSLKKMNEAIMDVIGSVKLRIEALDGPITLNP